MKPRIRCRIDECGLYILPADYALHARSAHQVTVHVCIPCAEPFETADDLAAHRTAQHPAPIIERPRVPALAGQAPPPIAGPTRRGPAPAPPIEEPSSTPTIPCGYCAERVPADPAGLAAHMLEAHGRKWHNGRWKSLDAIAMLRQPPAPGPGQPSTSRSCILCDDIVWLDDAAAEVKHMRLVHQRVRDRGAWITIDQARERQEARAAALVPAGSRR